MAACRFRETTSPGLFLHGRRKPKKCLSVHCRFTRQVRLYRYWHFISRSRCAKTGWYAADALIYAVLSVTSTGEGSHDGDLACKVIIRRKLHALATAVDRTKKVREPLTSGKKIDCENLRIPLSAQSDEKGGYLQFSSEIYDGRSRKLNTDPGIYNLRWRNGCTAEIIIYSGLYVADQ